ncbi:hypothetical protein GCM10022258_32710 [Aquimarina gracilis]
MCYSQNNIETGAGISAQDTYFLNRIKQEFFLRTPTNEPIKVDDIDGSPYLSEKFSPGKILDELTGKSEAVFLRYNIYNDEFEVKYDVSSENIVGLKKGSTLVAQLGDDKFYYKAFVNHKNEQKLGYLKEVYNSKNVVILKDYYQKLRLPKPAKTSLEKDIPAKLSNHQSYYLKTDKGTLIKIEMNRKKIANSFPNHQNEIKSFIKEKKLRFNDEKDLLQLANFYGTL